MNPVPISLFFFVFFGGVKTKFGLKIGKKLFILEDKKAKKSEIVFGAQWNAQWSG